MPRLMTSLRHISTWRQLEHVPKYHYDYATR